MATKVRKHSSAVPVVHPRLSTERQSAKALRLQRYHDLVDRRLAGLATAAELSELAALARVLDTDSPPHEFDEAIQSLSRDRQALLESMSRIEGLLERSSPVKPGR
jgi:hypothetical protein